MTRILLLFSSFVFIIQWIFGQVNTIIRNHTLDFFMATTTLGIEQNIKNTITIQFNMGYSYAETFSIYNARNLRGGLIDFQIRRYIQSEKRTSLSGFYAGFSSVYRFASYITDEDYYMDTTYVFIPNVKVNASYFSFGFIVGYQWEIVKNKLFWDNYIGICGRIGNGHQSRRTSFAYPFSSSIVQLYYSGPAPKFGTAICVAIR